MIDIRRQQLDSALYKANKALEIQPTEAYYLNNRGYVQLLRGNLEAGLADINESIAYNSDNSWAYRNKGWYYYLTEEYADALRLLNQAYTMDPFTEHIGRMLGETYLATDNKELACEWFAIALKNNEPGASTLKKMHCDE